MSPPTSQIASSWTRKPEQCREGHGASATSRVQLAPSADGGTAALLRRPADAIAPHFGADSAKRHREAADRAGVGYHEVALRSLAIDLDAAADIAPFLARVRETGEGGGGARTRALLETLEWSRPS